VPRITFTSHLERHVACPSEIVPGDTARAALDAYLSRYPAVRPYLFDEQGVLRPHVVVFVNGEQARDRKSLADAVSADAEIYVMQALSGGS
jgi:molybdopterin synthase sulfur carrier subunit